MKNQIGFLLLLGALENSQMDLNKCGIGSDLLALPENEKLWSKTNHSISLCDFVHALLTEYMADSVEVAVDGTLFPVDIEEGRFVEKLKQSVFATCEDLELTIHFDGYSKEEAIKLWETKDKLREKILKGELEYSYLTINNDSQICVLTEQQVQKLVMLSVEFGFYNYFDSITN